MANNVILFNAAFQGALAGATQRWNQDAVQLDYEDSVNAAVAFATQVDSKIPTNESIGDNQANTLRAICSGIISGRTPVSAVPSDYDAVANAIAANYRQAILSLLT
jgi:hypothetical protein